MPEAHDGVLRNTEVVNSLNFEVFPREFVDRGSVEEAPGHIAVVVFGQFEQVVLSLADVRVMAFATREVARVFQLLEAGHIGGVGVVEALISLHTLGAPVVVVVVMPVVVSMVMAMVAMVMTFVAVVVVI